MEYSKKDITALATDVWMAGSRGSATINVKFARKLSSDETKRIQELFRPVVEAEVTKLAAMPKRELNKSYTMSFMKICTTIEGEKHNVELTLNDACRRRIVNGRTIHDLMTVDEILKENASSYYYKKAWSGDWHGSESFNSLILGDDGCYMRVSRDEIYQPPCEIVRKNWPRTGMRKSFVKMTIDYIEQRLAEGWELVATSYDFYGTKKICLEFQKAS